MDFKNFWTANPPFKLNPIQKEILKYYEDLKNKTIGKKIITISTPGPRPQLSCRGSVTAEGLTKKEHKARHKKNWFKL